MLRLQFCCRSLALLALLVAGLSVPAHAGTVRWDGEQFSAGKPVNVFHFEGEVVEGDLERIKQALVEHVNCDPAMLPDMGGNCAVFTLQSPGGNYLEGLRIAHFFRDQAIATWVRSGDYCYSACAFAFLGGSGFASGEMVNAAGAYIDRTIEPAATLGFHAPYAPGEILADMVAEFGVEGVLGGTRESIALMIQELVRWNVDPTVLAHIANMGADEAFEARSARDLYLLRTALPDAPRRVWAPDPAEALRSACARLIAYHQKIWPDEAVMQIKGDIAYNIGDDDRGWSVSGYQLTDQPSALKVSYCGLHNSDAHLGGNADIMLLYGEGIEGYMRPALTIFHRPEGWSTLATGGVAAQRIFRKGALSDFFLDPDAALDGDVDAVWQQVKMHYFTTGTVPPRWQFEPIGDE